MSKSDKYLKEPVR